MANEVHSLRNFLDEVVELFNTLDRCQEVLFRSGFRRQLGPVLHDAVERLTRLSDSKEINDPEHSERMRDAGLSGPHLALKLESFSSSLQSFRDTASEERLDEALDKAGIILKSLASAIPHFGSFAQELIDFVLKELRRRLFGRLRH